MKTVLIIIGVTIILVYGFVLYCCVKVGAEAERDFHKIIFEREDSDNQ